MKDQTSSTKQNSTSKLTATRIGSIKRGKPASMKPLKSLTKTPSLRPVKRQQALK